MDPSGEASSQDLNEPRKSNNEEQPAQNLDTDEQSDSIEEEFSGDEPEEIQPRPPQKTDSGIFEDDVIEDSDDQIEEQQDELLNDSDEEIESLKSAAKNEQNMGKPFEEKKINLYSYQNILFNRSLNENRIIYLPTGQGKTLVSIASMYYYLCKEGEEKKIVFLANTIQLVKQQADSIKRNLEKIIINE